MKFLCIGYFDAAKMSALTKSETDAVMGECWPLLAEFYASGHVLLDLGIGEGTTSLRYADGKVEAVSGGLSGGAAIGSAAIIEAEDLAEAVSIASKHPGPRVPAGAALGWRHEVRPIHYYHEPKSAEASLAAEAAKAAA